MTTTLLDELIARIKTVTGVGEVWTDAPPDGVPYPHVVVTYDYSATGDLAGDARNGATRRASQVSLWQERASESEALKDALVAALDGYGLPTAGLRLRVRAAPRIVDPVYPVMHNALDVATVSLL